MISIELAHRFGLRWVLGREGNDPCDEWDFDTLLNLPDGLTYNRGKILFECSRCEQLAEWPADIQDFELGNPSNVCGGSPRCCP